MTYPETQPSCFDNEAFYDAEVGPVLLDLARRCEARGIGFVASVEFAPGSFGTTANVPAQKSDGGMLTALAAKAMGNIDSLAIAWGRRIKAQRRPHGSIVLLNLGLPTTPEDEAPTRAGAH